MITPLLGLLLAAKIVVTAHSGSILAPIPYQAMVEVRSCDGVLAPIYMDPKLVMAKQNPFLVNRLGDYEYFSVNQYEQVYITLGPDTPPMIIKTCWEVKRK